MSPPIGDDALRSQENGISHAGSVLAGKTVAFFQVTGFVVAVEVLLPELALSVGQGQ